LNIPCYYSVVQNEQSRKETSITARLNFEREWLRKVGKREQKVWWKREEGGSLSLQESGGEWKLCIHGMEWNWGKGWGIDDLWNVEFFVRMFCHTMEVRGDGRPWLWLCRGSFLCSLKQEFSIIYIDVMGLGRVLNERIFHSCHSRSGILSE
jgi:hypothetical protein